MTRKFKGRVILSGEIEGECVVSRRGFNTLASFYTTLLTGADSAISYDKSNEDLYGKTLTGRILCLPKSIGSTSAGATWDRIIHRDLAPKALLFSQHIDSFAASGIALAEVWLKKRVVTIDLLGEKFLQHVKNGDWVEIKKNGTVIIK